MANSWLEKTIVLDTPDNPALVADPNTSGGINAKEFHDALYEEAASYYGICEVPGSNHHRHILEFHDATWLDAPDDETPWCASFMCHCVNIVAKEMGYYPEVKNDTPIAKKWQNWGVSVNPVHIRKGDIVILTRKGGGHVALATGVQGNGYISLLGGNQGNMVQISTYDADRVIAVRRVA